MDSDEASRLEKHGLLFREPDAALVLSSGTGRNWPDGRGVFISHSRRLAAWVNEEDHLCLWVLQPNSNLKAAFHLFRSFEAAVRTAIQQEGYDFVSTPRLGFLTSCPSNIGTALRVEVRVWLPLLS